MIWLEFLAASMVILVAGTFLTRYGDVIADKSGLGRTWTGLILVAGVTSLPELVTGISSVAHDLPEIAVGDIVGSCAFNLLIIALMDALGGRTPLSARVRADHILPLALGAALLSILGMSVVAGPRMPAVGWVGAGTLVAGLCYVVAVRAVYIQQSARRDVGIAAEEPAPGTKRIGLRQAVLLYALNAAIVVAAASSLPTLASRIAATTGLGQTLTGNLIVAATTSLPEVVVSIAAVRLRADDLAFSNITGSTLFNVLILFIDDLAWTRGAILQSVSPGHAITVFAAILMNLVLIAALSLRIARKRGPLAWDSAAIVAIWAAATALLYSSRGLSR
ncbi:MAG: sodium:calcium antiporter [Planctomycetia bacterium]|nr:sodium:calcium antiporter [Planctomycetia bacterium]